MRPLESHVDFQSHLWMFNRVKELLVRDGLLCQPASDEETRDAINRWIEMVEHAARETVPLRH